MTVSTLDLEFPRVTPIPLLDHMWRGSPFSCATLEPPSEANWRRIQGFAEAMCSPPNWEALGHGLSLTSLHVRIFESPVRSIARSGNCRHMNRNIVMEILSRNRSCLFLMYLELPVW
jgi:hypothetical protein